ncbi:DUF4365 domain-containing protein [Vibrio parahaemolyticus]|uniref:DUF4365 domain-containing protein n=5 Tax=Vibrio parahaemolyticus TaxID=670 RepID=UPI00111E4907|nr:DUF4365 domain-containing protein [Vibrio parahaemolyticus]EIO4562344.1 DUF4365 domain-containing protein [Vibrio parahaemolyticus]EIO4614855.1 DUF4365 domain-containing protein [Vibrio parahaemolyticus]ELA7843448.1 DUF4365 domain-containing protein [Vibrio parahaemolyticus]ELA9311834.1 DUF4365 domain-containing protein [Vibrio parahaemolyticus]MBE4116041.1 DUF4365 domain-containing protein [Vibrio parahaemolyticus]
MGDWPIVQDEEQLGRLGVHLVGGKTTKSLGWVFRETSSTDIGIDGEMELRNKDLSSHGKRILLQIKCGHSYLSEENENSFLYRGSYSHLRYWTNLKEPVLIILCNPDTEVCYWQQISMENVNFHKKGWSIHVPKVQVLSALSKSTLEGLCEGYQTKDVLELLLRDWFGWRFDHKIGFANDITMPRDYHWLSMLARIDDEEDIMIDYLIADVNGFPMEDLNDMIKYAAMNSRMFSYKKLFIAFVSESMHYLNKIPEPQTIEGLYVEFIPFLFRKHNMELLEIGKDGYAIDTDYYQLGEVHDDERGIKFSGTFA